MLFKKAKAAIDDINKVAIENNLKELNDINQKYIPHTFFTNDYASKSDDYPGYKKRKQWIEQNYKKQLDGFELIIAEFPDKNSIDGNQVTFVEVIEELVCDYIANITNDTTLLVENVVECLINKRTVVVNENLYMTLEPCNSISINNIRKMLADTDDYLDIAKSLFPDIPYLHFDRGATPFNHHDFIQTEGIDNWSIKPLGNIKVYPECDIEPTKEELEKSLNDLLVGCHFCYFTENGEMIVFSKIIDGEKKYFGFVLSETCEPHGDNAIDVKTNFKSKMFIDENEELNPIVTNVSVSSDKAMMYDNKVITVFGGDKSLISVDATSTSGSGWMYGATIRIEIGEIDIINEEDTESFVCLGDECILVDHSEENWDIYSEELY